MERALIFAALQILACLYALGKGGAPERWAAVSYAAAFAASIAATLFANSFYSTLEWGVFAVDLLLAAALLLLALHANRYWTLWAASFQIVAICAHLAKMLVPEILAPAYAAVLIIWSYAAIPLLMIGTMRHQSRLIRYGSDANWSLTTLPLKTA
jgi:hypothetical protein